MKVEYPSGDLIKQEWVFNQFGSHFVFIGWTRMERKTKRHGWKAVDHWNKYENRFSPTSEPRLPKEVKTIVIEEATNLITVNTWAEWKHNK